MIDYLVRHPLATFLGCIIAVAVFNEIYCHYFPARDARWPRDIGFKARDPDELFRACNGDDT